MDLGVSLFFIVSNQSVVLTALCVEELDPHMLTGYVDWSVCFFRCVLSGLGAWLVTKSNALFTIFSFIPPIMILLVYLVVNWIRNDFSMLQAPKVFPLSLSLSLS